MTCTHVFNNKTPLKSLYKYPTTFHDLKVFGYLCFSSTLLSNITKLDHRGRKYIFIGFKIGTRGYLLFYLYNRNTFISISILFYEFPPYIDQTCNRDNHENLKTLGDLTFIDVPNQNNQCQAIEQHVTHPNDRQVTLDIYIITHHIPFVVFL